MRKPSARNGEDIKTVFSKTYHGACFILNDEVVIPNYLLHLPIHNYVIVEIDVEEDEYFILCHCLNLIKSGKSINK